MGDLIKLKRSSTPSAVPTAGQLELGELAINAADGRVYFKKSDGTVVFLAADSDPYVIPDQAITLGGHITVAHGLGVEPSTWKLKLRCKTAALGFSVGHVIACPEVADGYASSTGVSVRVDGTNMRINIATAGFWIVRDDTKAVGLATAAHWELFGEIWP